MNYSQITENLYLGTTPKGRDYDLLHELGVKLVINMRIGAPPVRDHHLPPMRSLWLPAFDSPLIPIPIHFLQLGVQEALKVIEQGGIIYTHCAKGRHRGAAMAACILIAQGMSADDAIRLIKLRRPVSDPQVWYIHRRVLKFANEWDKSSG